ncbi:MAG TPA: hypothetical protein VKU39_03140, partial [Streptosporangiaceae bacterium]|nr:hypothetical protein [Streptosporangiaceae bacterium]
MLLAKEHASLRYSHGHVDQAAGCQAGDQCRQRAIKLRSHGPRRECRRGRRQKRGQDRLDQRDEVNSRRPP